MSTYTYGSLCVSEGFVIVVYVADGYPGVSVQQGCQCATGVIVAGVASWLSCVSVGWG